MLAGIPGFLTLFDVGPHGQALINRSVQRSAIVAKRAGEATERDLSEMDVSYVADLAPDGQTLVGSDVVEGRGANDWVFLRRTDGSPPVWLGEGDAQALSPDGRWVLARLVQTLPGQLVLLPTGPGEPRRLERGPIEHYLRADWMPDGRRIVFEGRERGREGRLYLQDTEGGAPRRLTEAALSLPPLGKVASPDGRRLIVLGEDGTPMLQSMEGGDPSEVRGLAAGDVPIGWTRTGDALYFVRVAEGLRNIHKLDLATARARLWNEVVREGPARLVGQYRILITPDGGTCVYNYLSNHGTLYLVKGLQ